MMCTATDKKGYSDTRTICYIILLDLCIIHVFPLFLHPFHDVSVCYYSNLYKCSTRELISFVLPTFQKFSPR